MVKLRIVGIIGMLVMAGCLTSLYHEQAIAQEAIVLLKCAEIRMLNTS